MKRFSTLLSLIAISMSSVQPAAAQASKPDPNFHIYLLIGQSNMAGRGKVDSISKLPRPRILVFDSTRTFVPATDPLHFDKKVAGVGPGISFAEHMLPGGGRIKIGLVPAAVGGTSITSWVPGGFDVPTKTHPYDDMLVRIKAALRYGVLKGILWHQGEANSGGFARSPTYITQLQALVNRLRTELNAPNVPFVMGELGYYRPNYRNFNTMLQQVPDSIRNIMVVSAEGLGHKGDTTHFDTQAARELGKRFAAGMKRLQKK